MKVLFSNVVFGGERGREKGREIEIIFFKKRISAGGKDIAGYFLGGGGRAWRFGLTALGNVNGIRTAKTAGKKPVTETQLL